MSQAPSSPVLTWSTPLHLLLVEDEEADVELIAMTLETAGVDFTYDAVDRMDSCQQLLETRHYDAVLSDYRLPCCNGRQVLQLLLESSQDIPFILVTGNLGEEAAVELMKAGMTDYVLKDRLFRLPSVLARSLEEFQLRRQKQAALAQIQQQAQWERSLNQIARVLNSSLDPNYILQEIVRLTGEAFGVERVIIVAVQSERCRVLNEWRATEEIVSVQGYGAAIEGSDWLQLVDPNALHSLHHALHAPNYAEVPQDPCKLMAVHQAGIQSLLRLPIFIWGKLFGALSLQTITHRRSFQADEIEFLKRIADQAALALANARSYERLEQLVRERTRELEEAKLMAEAANRAKSEFLANVSHELRTPLSGILSLSQVLSQQFLGPLNDKQQQYVTTIASSGQHLLALINDLLDLAKIEAGREELAPGCLVIEKVCQSCLSLIRERANAQGLQLRLELDPKVSTWTADERRLKQILFNLLSNAVKFTEAGSVTLKVTQGAATLQFSVIDTGIGISPTDQAMIFEPFQQLKRHRSSEEGTGLGLALVRHLAHLHGGEITVTSELGKGSCFTLSLPRLQPDLCSACARDQSVLEGFEPG